MFRLSSVKTRYFEFEAPDNNRVLHIEPPKLKTLNQLNELSKQGKHSIGEMAGMIAKLISKNKENRKVTTDMVMEWMDSDQLASFVKSFVAWIRDEKKNDPN